MSYSQSSTANISKSKSKMDYDSKDMQWWFRLFNSHNLCTLFNYHWIISSKVVHVYWRTTCPNTIREPCNRHCKHPHGLPAQSLARFAGTTTSCVFFFFFFNLENEPNLEISRFCQEMSWPNMQYGRKII